MLLDLNGEVIISPKDQTPIKENWEDYIKYTEHYRLYTFTKNELREKIKAIKKQGRSFIDSAILIGGFLRELSVNENFNQQFRAVCPNLNCIRILAIQLFILMLEDDDKWIFSKSERDGFVFTDANKITLMYG